MLWDTEGPDGLQDASNGEIFVAASAYINKELAAIGLTPTATGPVEFRDRRDAALALYTVTVDLLQRYIESAVATRSAGKQVGQTATAQA